MNESVNLDFSYNKVSNIRNEYSQVKFERSDKYIMLVLEIDSRIKSYKILPLIIVIRSVGALSHQ